MIYKLVRDYKKGYKSFEPFPPAADRKRWNQMEEYLKKKWIGLGEHYRDTEFPQLPADSYMDFCRIGDRAGYEAGYFARRRMLYALVMAECMEGKQRFLLSIANGIMAICEESGWQLPAHNHYDSGEHYNLPDVTKPVMDLFACETAAGLAMTTYLLKEELNNLSPVICKRIQHELEKRMLTPYLTQSFFWMGKPGQKVNNWTAWCTQNTLIALMSMDNLSQETRRQIMEQAAESLDIFLDTYGPDGCCNEGASYYRVAGLCLFNALEVMNAVTDEGLAAVYKEEKIRNIAPYIMNVHIEGEYYANFADCVPICERAGVREYLFAKRIGNESMMLFAAKDYKENRSMVMPRQSENLYYFLQSAFTHDEIIGYETDREVPMQDIYYESVGLLLARDTFHFLAVKAGGNDDSHNHNDTGSIIFYDKGRPILIDAGVGTYSRQTFSAQRYDIWTMQSAYHNVLTFGDTMQMAGPEYRSEVTQIRLSESEVMIAMELSGCYPKGTVDFYRREVIFEKHKQLRVTDRFSPYTAGTYLSLMTAAAPKWQAPALQIGTMANLYFESNVQVVTEEIVLQDERLRQQWGESVYRTKVIANESEISFTVKLKK